MTEQRHAEECDVVVIGAGVIGLAVGQALAREGRDVLVLESQDSIGTETSSRNSEVIHAGIYYPTNSLKAKLCVRGKHLLYQYCKSHHVPYENIGKFIVATSVDQFDTLRQYQSQAMRNGVGELPWLSKQELESQEPAVACLGGILSPTTGILDSHAYMLSLVGELEAHGGMIAFLSRVKELTATDSLLVATDQLTLAPRVVVNAAGLDAPSLSSKIGRQFRSYYAKGHYYSLWGVALQTLGLSGCGGGWTRRPCYLRYGASSTIWAGCRLAMRAGL